MRFERDGFQVEAAILKGRELPEWYLDQPPMLPGDEFYLRAFYLLSSCRAYAGGPIPWTLIAQYAAGWGLSGAMAVHFTVVMRELDTAFLEWHGQEQQRRDRMARQQTKRESQFKRAHR